MAAYLLVNIDVTDPVRYADYIKLTPATIEQYGGRYLVRGGRAERLEGTVEPKRVVVLEFESAERARAWWSSEEYAGARAIRQSSSKTDLILVDGV